MLTVDQQEAFRAAVKSAAKDSPLYIAYHSGDGKNRHDVWETALDEEGRPMWERPPGNLGSLIEVRHFVRTEVTDAGGDCEAIAAHFNAPDPEGAVVWQPISTVAFRRALISHPAEFAKLSGEARSLIDFVLSGDNVVELDDAGVREALREQLGAESKAWATVTAAASRPASRAEALVGAAFPEGLTAVDLATALYHDDGTKR